MRSMLVLLSLLGISMLAFSGGVKGQSEEEILRLKIRELELRKEILELEAKKSQSSPQVISPDPIPSYQPPAKNNYSPPASTNSQYIRGPRGGCYTFSSSGRKRYVDRSLCN
jgi:hypothetical protein